MSRKKEYAIHIEGRDPILLKKSKVRILYSELLLSNFSYSHYLALVFQVQIGRHTSNDIVINNIKVSRFHANISVLEDNVFIEDLKVSIWKKTIF